MNQYDVAALTNAPQQQRSHSLTLRILEAAEQVLQRDGMSGFTIRAVAAKAEVSVGGIYRRFEDREELLTAIHSRAIERLELRVTAALSDPSIDCLAGLVATFVDAVAATFRDEAHLFSIAWGTKGVAAFERAVRGQEHLHRAFAAAALRYRADILRPDPDFAIRTAMQLVLATLIRRAAFGQRFGVEAQSWPVLCAEIAVAAKVYLTSALPAGSD